MNLFGFGKPTDPEAQEDQRLIEAGGLPRSATARLVENANRQGTPDHLFTSDMSVNELLLTHECGYEPLAQVMGTSVYHVGWQYLPGQTWGSVNPITGLPPSQELFVLTQARYDARRLAFGRLLQETSLLYADGVVAVRFEQNEGNLPEGTIEFRAIGTAVRQSGRPPSTSNHRPFLSNLSGQDHWTLRKAGYKPVGFVFGNCSWYQVSSWRNQSIDFNAFGMGVNAEYPDFTQAFYQARELAASRLTEEARALHAIGVVGVTIEPEIKFIDIDVQGQGNRRDLLVQFTMWGTAIAYEDGPQTPLSPIQVVRLDDKDSF